MSIDRRVGLFEFGRIDEWTYPEGHPFRPERANMLMQILKQEGVLGSSWLTLLEPKPVSREVLERFHSRAYLDALEKAGRGEFSVDALAYGIGSEDCPIFRGVLEMAAITAGATLEGARSLVSGQWDLVFNPIGGFHHAGSEFAEGFCYVNDVALACAELADQGYRVACVDLDVHHGNGTEEAFFSDPRVLTISTHESGKTLYPWGGWETEIGQGEGLGYNVNIPLPAGCDDSIFLRAFRGVVLPLLGSFDPHVIVFEAGMDVLKGDPLAHLNMTNNGLADAAEEIRRLGKPVLLLGGGGYHPQNSARGWALVLTVLADKEASDGYEGLVSGVFLGDAERPGALRDMQVFTSGGQRQEILDEVERVIEFHRRTVFPIHGL